MIDTQLHMLPGRWLTSTPTAAQNATATLCKQPVRDRSLVAPIATAITGGMALAFVLLRVYESAVRKKEFEWPDVCAILAFVRGTVLKVEKSPANMLWLSGFLHTHRRGRVLHDGPWHGEGHLDAYARRNHKRRHG